MMERTTAHLSNSIDARIFEIERLHVEKGARLTAQSHMAAIDHLRRRGIVRVTVRASIHTGGD